MYRMIVGVVIDIYGKNNRVMSEIGIHQPLTLLKAMTGVNEPLLVKTDHLS